MRLTLAHLKEGGGAVVLASKGLNHGTDRLLSEVLSTSGSVWAGGDAFEAVLEV